MKRLVMLLVAVMAVTPFAQTKGKDLAGAWVFDAVKSGTEHGPATLVITLMPKTVSVQMGDKPSGLATFNLDGTETSMDHGGKAKIAWKGAKLEVTMSGDAGAPQSITFGREGDWLVEEGQTPKGPMKIYFKKAPAK